MKTQAEINELMMKLIKEKQPAIPKQYAQIEGKTFDMLKAELLDVYKRYPEYHEKGFKAMVDLFATDDFYHEHYVAKKFNEMALEVVCCVCEKHIKYKDGKGMTGISHSYCVECAKEATGK